MGEKEETRNICTQLEPFYVTLKVTCTSFIELFVAPSICMPHTSFLLEERDRPSQTSFLKKQEGMMRNLFVLFALTSPALRVESHCHHEYDGGLVQRE